MEAELADSERAKLMKLCYTGAVGGWCFALYLADSDRYEDSMLPTGSPRPDVGCERLRASGAVLQGGGRCCGLPR
ncbi:hypothetical protein AB0E67_32230 [Streptomyces sp. NPDC032161]|uniref:hypothetical protein n=1 Tax=unclassified Streptomyces TaxID=2593676 RepID=UPI0033E053FB